MAAVEVPLFPLHSVLFPGGRLALRVFERRYLDMVGSSLKTGTPFGVVAIQNGSDVGSADIFAVGTLAEIVDWSRGPDGILGIEVVGRDVFRLAHVARRDDGLYVGEIVVQPAEPRVPVPESLRFVAEFLWAASPEARGDPLRDADDGDASSIGFRLAEVLPLPLAARQAMLELGDPVARIERLAPIVARTYRS